MHVGTENWNLTSWAALVSTWAICRELVSRSNAIALSLRSTVTSFDSCQFVVVVLMLIKQHSYEGRCRGTFQHPRHGRDHRDQANEWLRIHRIQRCNGCARCRSWYGSINSLPRDSTIKAQTVRPELRGSLLTLMYSLPRLRLHGRTFNGSVCSGYSQS